MMKLACGTETIDINLKSVNVSPESSVMQKITTVEQAKIVNNAFRNPLSGYMLTKWLAKLNKLVIIIPDITRKCGTNIFLDEIVNYLESLGVTADHIIIVVANGNHRHYGETELRRLVGSDVFSKYRVENHNSDANLVDVGTTPSGNRISINKQVVEADRVLITGNITYHNFAGFSGGRKSILPGVSGRETIIYNHRLMLDGDQIHNCCRLGVIEGNPIHNDMIEAVKLLDPDESKLYCFNVVTNMYGQIIAAFCGRTSEVFDAGVALAREKYRISVPVRGDLVLCSSGGYPYDINFYQSFKSLYASSKITADSGVLFILAECRDGLGESYEKFRFWFSRSQPEIIKELARNFDVVGQIAYWTKHAINHHQVWLVTAPKNLEEFKSLGIPAIGKEEMLSALTTALSTRVNSVTYTIPYGNISCFELA
jgi:nickel-dependent lactate racemase